MPRSSKHIAGYAALTLVVVATGSMAYGAVAGSGSDARSNSRTVTVQRGSISQTVSATGNLQPDNPVDVNFQTSGTITEIDVAAGDQVTVGQVLAKLDSSDASASLIVATLQLNAADVKLMQAAAGTSTASQGASATTPDQASVAQTTADQPTVDQAAVDTAQASVIQAQSSVDAAQKVLDATTLTAPANGVVSSVTKAVGDQVTAGSNGSGANNSASGANNGSTSGANSNSSGSSNGSTSSTSSSSTAAFTIVNPNAYEVKVGFPESDAIKVQVGQQAVTTLDALPGTSLPGTVVSIDQTATVTSNVVTYDAIVSVTGAPATAKSGMTANVTVTTVSKDDVLELPTAAVQTQAGSSFVNKQVNGQSVQTPVTTGLQGDSTTEITSGLSEGDQVVIDTGTLTTSATRGGTGGTGGTGGGGATVTGGAGGFGGGGGFAPGAGGFAGRGN